MKSKKILYTIGLLFLVSALLILSVELSAFSKSFYQKQYLKLNTASDMHMSEADLMAATNVLLDYITDKKDSIDLKVQVQNETVVMFNEREKLHMIDVKELYLSARNVKYIAFFLFISIFVLYIFQKDYLNARLNRSVLRNSVLILSLGIGIIAFFAILDFNAFWTGFHKLFFTNDLWLLNPYTDRMINMFPEPFFNAMVMSIITSFIGFVLFIPLVVITINRKRRKKI